MAWVGPRFVIMSQGEDYGEMGCRADSLLVSRGEKEGWLGAEGTVLMEVPLTN